MDVSIFRKLQTNADNNICKLLHFLRRKALPFLPEFEMTRPTRGMICLFLFRSGFGFAYITNQLPMFLHPADDDGSRFHRKSFTVAFEAFVRFPSAPLSDAVVQRILFFLLAISV